MNEQIFRHLLYPLWIPYLLGTQTMNRIGKLVLLLQLPPQIPPSLELSMMPMTILGLFYADHSQKQIALYRKLVGILTSIH
jgi:hypothetical protein